MSVSVERGTTTITDGNATATITLSNPVPVGESFPWICYRGGTATRTERIDVVATLQTDVSGEWTELHLERNTGSDSVIVEWQVITSSDFTVQAVEYDVSGLSNTAAISSVTLSEAFLVPSQRITSNVNFAPVSLRHEFTSSSEVQATRGSTDATITTRVYVVEWSGSTVQSGTMSGSASSLTDTITSVDLTHAFILGSMSTTGGSDGREVAGRLDLEDATTARYRKNRSNDAVNVSYFVVEHSDISSVEKAEASMSDASESDTIASVATSETFVVTRLAGNGESTTASIDNIRHTWMLEDATTANAERNSTSGTITTLAYVVEVESTTEPAPTGKVRISFSF